MSDNCDIVTDREESARRLSENDLLKSTLSA